MTEEQETEEITPDDFVRQVDDHDYFVGNNVFVEAEEDTFIVKAPVDNFEVGNRDGSDDYKIVAVASMLQAMFKKFFSPHDLDVDNFYIHIEVHEKQVKEEIRKWIEETGLPAMIELDEGDYESEKQRKNDPRRFQPEINIVDEKVGEVADQELVRKNEKVKEENEEYMEKLAKDEQEGGEDG